MDSYEAHLVQDFLAAGDLTAIERLIHALFEELGARLESIRNPRRLGWYRYLRASLLQLEELPSPPIVATSTKTEPIHTAEVELCAKHVVASGDLCAVEALFQTIAAELDLTALTEIDPARRRWMSEAGKILSHAVIEDVPGGRNGDSLEAGFPNTPFLEVGTHHLAMRVFATILLMLVGIAVVNGLVAPMALSH